MGQGSHRTSYPKKKIKILLLENVHASALELLEGEEFQIEAVAQALPENELIERVRDAHVLGIRSKTLVTPAVLREAKKLLGVGCFCIGTNQVDTDAANRGGVPVFNAPFSNTRSVAELILCEVIALARQLPDRIREMHAGSWKKVSAGCHEVRGKTLGIVGYGHIGSQVGVLAEALGMRVVYFDIVAKLALGNARVCKTLGELLGEADFVTLHVPETPQTRGLIGTRELAAMKKGASLLNASRGTVVDIDALAAALRDRRLGGAAVDVYPTEPEANAPGFRTPLQELPNVILTPHVGGSTEEAQEAIGREVAQKLIRFVNLGSTDGSVNFPQIDLPLASGAHRILNVHRNVPGVLKDINRIVADRSANIRGQMLATDSNVGYLVMDLEQNVSDVVKEDIMRLPTSIRTRILY